MKSFADFRTSTQKVELDEAVQSPYHQAGKELNAYADKIGSKHMDHSDFKHHAKLLMSKDP